MMCDSGRDETKKKYVQLYMDGPGYCVPLSEIGSVIHGELESSEVGEQYELKLVEMTDEEYDNAPEFEGW